MNPVSIVQRGSRQKSIVINEIQTFAGRAAFVLHGGGNAADRANERGAAFPEQYALLFISFIAPVMSCSTLADADNLQETVISIAAFECALTLQLKFHSMAESCSYFQDTPQLSLQNTSPWMTLVKAPARYASHGNKKICFLSCLALRSENGRVSPINLQLSFLFSHPHPSAKATSSFL